MKRSGSRSEATATALVEAALEIVRESGVKSVTHRKVCSRAGVALGSSTYHYENLDALILDAFAHYVETVSVKYEDYFSRVTCDEELIDAMLRVTTILTTDVGNAILDWELLAEAGREQAYRELAQRWSHRARSAIEAYVSKRTAFMLETIWDGTTIQRVLNGTQLSDADLRDLIGAALALDTERKYPASAATPQTRSRKAPAPRSRSRSSRQSSEV
ncbi:MAG: TetR family transcriptional regulator [Actinomycetota bacterium]